MDFTTALTDIHTHVLFNLDDGPGTLEESMEFLSFMRAQGIQRVFCTSHYCSPHFDVKWADIRERFNVLSETIEELPGSFPNIKIAAEVRIRPELVEDIRNGLVPTLGDSQYVLIELPGHDIPDWALNIIYELQVLGHRPILAHPERNLAVQRDLNWIHRFTEMGVYLQLTADCLKRKSGSQHMVDSVAWKILKQGQATVIASDAHNTTSRPPVLADAYENITRHLGEETTNQLKYNANAIWNGDDIAPVPVTVSGRSWTRRLFRLRS